MTPKLLMVGVLRKRWFRVGIILLLAVCGYAAWRLAHPVYRVRISRETTYLTSPLRPNGMVNYVAAINQKLQKGITEANNAGPLLIQAIGPRIFPDGVRERVMGQLGMPPLPEKGHYLGNWIAYLRANAPVEAPKTAKVTGRRFVPVHAPAPGAASWPAIPALERDDLEKAIERTWKKDEFPLLARFLQENEEPLQLIVPATRRPRLYLPLVSGPPSNAFIHVNLPNVFAFHQAGEYLAARAMAKLPLEDVDGAWADLLACHRLARLVGQAPDCAGWSVAVSLEKVACQADKSLLAKANLTGPRARQMLADLLTLGPLPGPAEAVNEFERYAVLDQVAILATEGLNRWVDIANATGGSSVETPAKPETSVDWNRALVSVNSIFDQYCQAYRTPTPAERRRALPSVTGEPLISRARLIKDPEGTIIGVLMPTFEGLALPHDVALTSRQLLKVGFALAAYKAEKGTYPERLATLTPTYLKEIPRDRFAEQPLIYRRQGKGYIAYSFGPNMKDDGGSNDRWGQSGLANEGRRSPLKDDIAVSVK